MTGIILASGFSRRFNGDKLLAIYKHQPLIQIVIENCLDSRLDEVIVIYRNPEVLKLIKKYPIHLIENPNAHEGMSASLKLGIGSLNPSVEACMVIMGDQPLFLADDFNRLISHYLTNPILTAAAYNNQRKTPVIFPRKYFNDLLETHGDSGGRHIIDKEKNKQLVVFDQEKLFDIDTQEELNQINISKEDYHV